MNAIQDIIKKAKEQSESMNNLIEFLRQRKPFLHDSILLPEAREMGSLTDFVSRYIDHVPEFVEAIETLTHEAHIEDDVRPLLNIIYNYFLSPPDVIPKTIDLVALLDEAYLAHRLLEEINDRFMAKSGVPLTPMDNTMANLIAHELIGEPFANTLDQSVLFSAELLLNEHKMESESIRQYIDEHKAKGWSDEIKRWPCLADKLDIRFEFPEDSVTTLN